MMPEFRREDEEVGTVGVYLGTAGQGPQMVLIVHEV